MAVAAGSAVAVIGANGAGKSTLLQAIAGAVPIAGGDIRFDGASLRGVAAHHRVQRGISLVPEGRRIFPSLTVGENLEVGRYRRRPRAVDGGPRSSRRSRSSPSCADRSAARLSGGEQQALAIGRALMNNPTLLLLDEVSLGLAPVVVKQLYRALPAIRDEGTTLVLVEQDINQALATADHVYCLLEGRVSLHGPPAALDRDAITAAYFGTPIGARSHDELGQRRRPGDPRRRAVRALRRRAVAELRRDATGQPLPRRLGRARRLRVQLARAGDRLVAVLHAARAGAGGVPRRCRRAAGRLRPPRRRRSRLPDRRHVRHRHRAAERAPPALRRQRPQPRHRVAALELDHDLRRPRHRQVHARRFAVAVAVLGLLSLFIARTRLGRAFRATSDDLARRNWSGSTTAPSTPSPPGSPSPRSRSPACSTARRRRSPRRPGPSC